MRSTLNKTEETGESTKQEEDNCRSVLAKTFLGFAIHSKPIQILRNFWTRSWYCCISVPLKTLSRGWVRVFPPWNSVSMRGFSRQGCALNSPKWVRSSRQCVVVIFVANYLGFFPPLFLSPKKQRNMEFMRRRACSVCNAYGVSSLSGKKFVFFYH